MSDLEFDMDKLCECGMDVRGLLHPERHAEWVRQVQVPYTPCSVCHDQGGSVGPYPETDCHNCGLPFMADETLFGRLMIAGSKRGFERGADAALKYARDEVSSIVTGCSCPKAPCEHDDMWSQLLKRLGASATEQLGDLLKRAGLTVWVHRPDCAIWKSVGGSHKCDKGCGPPK